MVVVLDSDGGGLVSVDELVDVQAGEFRVEAAQDHLTRYVGKDPLNGVVELIWNSLDADATLVTVSIDTTSLGAVDVVRVSDDGHGFDATEIKPLFSTLGGSWKKTKSDRRTRSGKRLLHGSKGHGRWKALAIGDRVRWSSVVEDENGTRTLSELSMSSPQIDVAYWTGPVSTTDDVGTKVVVTAGMKEPTALLAAKAAPRLTAAFALYLEMYPSIAISYRGTLLRPESMQVARETFELDGGGEHGPAVLTIIEWNTAVDPELALCDADGATLETVSLPTMFSGLHLTAYVAWAGFRVHQDKLGLGDGEAVDVAHVVGEAREKVREFVRDRRVVDQRSTIETWQDEDVYPFTNEPTGPVELANQAVFNYVAVAAQDALNSIENLAAKRLSMQSIKLALESDPGSLEKVIGEVLKLPQDKLAELSELLERTSLTAVIAASRMVTHRLSLLQGLRTLIFDSEISGTVLERAHLHNVIGEAPWIFGEEYATHVSDQSLTALLKEHIAILERDALIGDAVLDDEGKSRRIDFMFGRALELHINRREHLVVEIKRPSVTLRRAEFAQIEDYARVITEDSRFDREAVSWTFVLVGRDVHREVEHRTRSKGKPLGLIADPDGGPEIWVRTWAQIFEECDHRLKFIRNELAYDPTSEEALEFMRVTYPEFLPESVRSPQGDMREPTTVSA